MKPLMVSLAVAATLSVGVAAPAQAEDQRPCVSKVEFNGMVGANRGVNLTRSQVEQRWDVAGLGWSTYVPGLSDGAGDYLMAYPRCGYSRTEGWYAAGYHRGVNATRIWTIVEWRES